MLNLIIDWPNVLLYGTRINPNRYWDNQIALNQYLTTQKEYNCILVCTPLVEKYIPQPRRIIHSKIEIVNSVHGNPDIDLFLHAKENGLILSNDLFREHNNYEARKRRIGFKIRNQTLEVL